MSKRRVSPAKIEPLPATPPGGTVPSTDETSTPFAPVGVPVAETPDNLKAREAAFKKRRGRTPSKR